MTYSVVTLGVIRCVDGILSVGNTSLVTIRGLDLSSDITVGASNCNSKTTTSLTCVDGVVLADRSSPVHAL